MRRRLLLLASSIALAFILNGQAAALAAEEITVRGRLARTVEAGGWLIATSTQKYLILNPQRFQNESWFRGTTEVEATGETKPGTITIYQEGIPFEVRSMRPLGGAGATTDASARGANTTRVVVTGDANVQAQPDTATIVIAVITENRSASEAQAENASKSEAVVRAVKAAAGPNAEVKTSGYSLQPQYIYKQNEAPVISGYTARNSVVVTMSELNKVGVVIDAATRAGANSIDNLSFTLRRDRPARDQALVEATREALSKAQVIAQAVGGRVLRIIEVQEGGMARPPIIYAKQESLQRTSATADAPTPIEVGSLEIRSQVQLIAEIEARP